MTGLLMKKYHVAVLDNNNNGFVKKVVGVLKTWYNNKIVIQTYQDTHEMFEAVNVNRAKNKPFDMAVVSPDQMAERLVLQRANPNLKVVVCEDEQAFRAASAKVLL